MLPSSVTNQYIYIYIYIYIYTHTLEKTVSNFKATANFFNFLSFKKRKTAINQ